MPSFRITSLIYRYSQSVVAAACGRPHGTVLGGTSCTPCPAPQLLMHRVPHPQSQGGTYCVGWGGAKRGTGAGLLPERRYPTGETCASRPQKPCPAASRNVGMMAHTRGSLPRWCVVARLSGIMAVCRIGAGHIMQRAQGSGYAVIPIIMPSRIWLCPCEDRCGARTCGRAGSVSTRVHESKPSGFSMVA